MKYFPEIVTFRITSRCNNNCKHCFRPKHIKELNFPELKKILRLFYKRGVKAVVLTGGEPLIRADFDKILKELKSYNFKIFLDTNGDLFLKHKKIISKYVDIIGLPIDFPDSSYRNKNNFKKILKILGYYKQFKKRPLIRVGTVVTKDNFNKLKEIGELLKNYPIDTWKLYQFTPQGINAIKNRLSFEISQKQFNKKTSKIKSIFSNFFKIAISDRKDRNRAYFFLNPNGVVFMPIDDFNVCREKKIGSIFSEDIVSKWGKLISKNNYITNIKSTFNYKF